MLRVGIVGLGFMGRMHYEIYRTMREKVAVVAIADIGRDKLTGDWSTIGGNMAMGEGAADFTGIATYDTPDALIADEGVDVVDITLPTYLHRDYAVKALSAGKHVLCEKPMARNTAEADDMLAAYEKSGKLLLIGQCIRFWPAYAKARELVQDGAYGLVKTARFQRFSTMPVWNWDGWLLEPGRSGLAALDLHIHDADFIAHLFGLPESVTSFGGTLHPGGFDHILTRYAYPDGKLVTAEGGWEYAPGFPFSMTFAIHMEKASLELTAGGRLNLYPSQGDSREISLGVGTGYQYELAHFIECLEENRESQVLTARSARDSVRLVEAEICSASSGRTVAL